MSSILLKLRLLVLRKDAQAHNNIVRQVINAVPKEDFDAVIL